MRKWEQVTLKLTTNYCQHLTLEIWYTGLEQLNYIIKPLLTSTWALQITPTLLVN